MIPRMLAILIFAMTPPAIHAQDGWLLFRGNAQRTSAASKLPAWEKPSAWQRPLLLDKIENEIDPDQPAKALVEKLRKDAAPSILPGSFPIIVKDVCVYRSYRDVRAVAVREIVLKDPQTGEVFKIPPSEIQWKSIPLRSSLSMLLERNQTYASVPVLVELLQAHKQDHWVWANPAIGSLSSDGNNVFMIDDFAFAVAEPPKVGKVPVGLLEMKSLLVGNELTAHHAQTGKLQWDAGRREGARANPVFRGAPFPRDGKLYLLNQKGDDLRLLSMDLDPKKWKAPRGPDVEKTLVLMKIPAAEQPAFHPFHRTQALHIAEAGELLICPTHAGVLFGVDRAKMEVRWKYEYLDKKAIPTSIGYWQAACPMVHKERILFTAADSPLIHCIGLDGAKKWSVAADNDLYLATAHDDIVLLIGKTQCRALALADGKEKWKLDLGLPAGVGVKDGSIYYVPIKNDIETKAPTIWAIDLAKGAKVRRIPMPHPDALGNLALHRGMFVSQSVTHIAAFPLLAK